MEEDHPFMAIAALHKARGVPKLTDLPGCWEVKVGDDWWFALNGHDKQIRCSKGAEVPPFNAYVMYGDWPAGFIDPYGGVFAAGRGANVESFTAAVRAAIASPA